MIISQLKTLWLTLLTTFAATFLVAASARAQPSVLTRSYNNQRTGENNQEYILTPNNVNASTMSLLKTLKVPDQVYAQILYVPAVTMSSGPANLIVVADVSNTVSVFDADTYAQYWQTQFAAPINVGNNGTPGSCCNFTGNVGIVGTPVIVPQSVGYSIYFVTRTAANPNVTYKLWNVNLSNGLAYQSVVIASPSGFTPSFNSYFENQRSALLYANGQI